MNLLMSILRNGKHFQMNKQKNNFFTFSCIGIIGFLLLVVGISLYLCIFPLHDFWSMLTK